jgi:glyoxylase-like metal-dependent hydrolase (beta-lactamase superfamily II)
MMQIPVRAALPLIAFSITAPVALGQPRGGPPPIVKRDAAVQVAEHVYVIPDDNVGLVPNVGIVIGERATLVIDPGLGERNGEIVRDEAAKVGAGSELYLAATHFHPEHDLGAGAFPEDATMVRWSVQQREVDELGEETISRFSGFSNIVSELLDGARYRPADTSFDEELTLDLGGVLVRAIGVGPNHTLGDTVFFVAQDRVLFTGDVVMSVFPAVSAASGSIEKWLANLDALEALGPNAIVPAHGRLGDVTLIRRYREYFTAVRDRTTELKRGGLPVEAAIEALTDELGQEFADLEPISGPQPGRIGAAITAAYREAE